MARVDKTIEIDPTELVLTNPNIDPSVYESMAHKLKKGEIVPEDLTIPYVTFEEGMGFCVNDGNHTVKACQIAGVKKIKIDLY